MATSGRGAIDLDSADLAHVLHPNTNLAALHRSGPLVLVRGEGVRVFDNHGRSYIEAMAGLWCTTLGYGDEELARVAYEQMKKLSFSHMFTGKSHEPGVLLADKLAADVFKQARVTAFEKVAAVPASVIAGIVCAHPLADKGYDFDVPLLAETGVWRTRCDRILVIDCSEAVQVDRVMRRSGWSADQVLRVIAQQASRSARRAAADAVILNDTLTLAALEAEVDALWALGFFGVPASARL